MTGDASLCSRTMNSDCAGWLVDFQSIGRPAACFLRNNTPEIVRIALWAGKTRRVDSNAKVSIRVRIKNDSSATLTIKSRSSKLCRREFEYAIPIPDAEELISFRRGHVVEKVRYIVPCDKLNWEIDVFSGENLGLITAEIELLDENHQIELPPWVGSEVTGQDRYYNGALAQHPYVSWLRSDAPVAAE